MGRNKLIANYKMDSINCSCGNILLKKENKKSYRCSKCHTVYSSQGFILFRPTKLVRNA